MSADALMPIGMFSRASLLSIKALRAYHQAGILVPARVDPQTGYRAYQASQLPDAGVLRRLRALDLPLADIGEILRARDPDVTRKVLSSHGDRLQDRLAQIATAVAEIQASVEHPISQTPVHVRDQPATLTLAQTGRIREADFSSFLEQAYGALYLVVARLGLSPTGPSGALYPSAVHEVEEVVAYVPIAEAVQLPDDRGPVALDELPAVTIAVLTHHGSYEAIGETYRLLGRWVAENAASADLPIREVYVVSPSDTDEAEHFRTDICWPLASSVPTKPGGF